MAGHRPQRALPTPLAVRVARFAVPSVLLGLATTGIVTAATGSVSPQQTSAPALVAARTQAPALTDRAASTSRGSTPARPALVTEAAASAKARKAAQARKVAQAAKAKVAAPPAAPDLDVVDRRYTRVDLNVRSAAEDDSRLVTVLRSGSSVSVTATVRDGWRYVSYRGRGAWVKNRYLVDKKPAAAAAGISAAACQGGSAVESGLTPDAVRVHRAICARFPAVTAYGGVRADALPEHPSGRALDAMVPSLDTGWQIARWVRANAKQLGVSEVIFAQSIWTVQRGGEGWRSFADRGSPSANHTDHVHVTVYGNSGG